MSSRASARHAARTLTAPHRSAALPAWVPGPASSSSTLAQSWNADLAFAGGPYHRHAGTAERLHRLVCPATNMHRSPFNGRNYEYYSEDSLLSGAICGNTVQGANDAGVYTYVKHFICNDGERHLP